MAAIWSDALRRAADALARRRRAADGEAEESGFTLIELMVVLLIMGILMAIAIPTFLGVTAGANDRSTQSNLVNVMTSAKAIYAQHGSYTDSATMATTLGKDLPTFTYKAAAASTKQTVISVYTAATGTSTTLVVAAWMTKTKICWVAKDSESATPVGVHYGVAVTTTAQTACKATTATIIADATGNKWPTAPAGH